MFRTLAVSAITAIAIAATSGQRVEADAGDAIAGGIIGGLIGGVIVNEANKKKRTKRRVYSSGNYSAQRQENREIQTSLNYFGYPAGTPDGVLGRRSRNAVSSYQIYMGYPVTGHLTEFQKTVLLNSYHQAIAGGYNTNQIIAASPDGHRGLLKHTQSQMAGGGGTVVAIVPQQQVTTFASTTETASSDGGFTLPTFGDAPGASSMANHCNKISLITNTNGGYTNVSTMQDPVFTLNEQFCLARIYAISESEEMIGQVQGISAAQMQQQCETLGPAFKEQVAALSLSNRNQVISSTSDMILSTGMAPAQLSHTAKICLGIGYRTDNADVALASTLILVTLGEQVYGELLGHHLINGFGTSQRNDLALPWYTSATEAIAAGQPAVFVPGQTGRPALIQAAALQLGAPAATQSQSATFVLPTFGSGNTTDQ